MERIRAIDNRRIAMALVYNISEVKLPGLYKH